MSDSVNLKKSSFGEAPQAEHFGEGDEDVEEAEATDGAAEAVGLEEFAPLGLEIEEVVQIPGAGPGVDQQEDAKFKTEDAEEDCRCFVQPCGGGRAVDF